MSAQEEVDRKERHDGEHQPHDEAGHPQVLGKRVAFVAPFTVGVEGRLGGLLHGRADAFFARPEPAQQGEDR